VRLAINPPHSVGQRAHTASIGVPDGAVVAGEDVPPALLEQVRQFIAINRDTLVDYWEYRIDTEQLRQRLRSILR
jgi:hypothetical protein